MRGIIHFFVKHPIWANALIFFTILTGFISFLNLQRSFFPERRIKDVYVEVAYPGASPDEMQEGITIKVEEALKGIAGIEEVNSTSRENMASIHVVGMKGYDIDDILTDVKNAVDQISSFPDGAEKPNVYKKKPLDPTINLSLHGERSLMELKREAEKIEDDFLNSGHISQISILGLPELEFSIEVSEHNLQKYGLTFAEIRNAIASNNIDISAGEIKSPNEELIIRARSRDKTTEHLKNIAVRANTAGKIIKVKDIADVHFQFAETPNKTLYNGQQSVSINVSKLPEEDIIFITDYIKSFVSNFNDKHDDMSIHVVYDRSVALNQRIDLLTSNGITGLILVLVTLGIFLNGRLAFWVAAGIPISFLGMMILANITGITINQITLFGMILVIGILVDDGIVIAENIYSHTEKGKSPVNAAIDGTMEVLPSVFTSVTTTILAFSVFFFLEGNIGEFISEMAIVVIGCLAFSLIEAALILPAHLNFRKRSYREKSAFTIMAEDIGKWVGGGKVSIRSRINNGINYVRYTLYGTALTWLMAWRWAAFSLLVFFILVISGMRAGGIISFSFFPDIDSNNLTVSLELTPGVREGRTEFLLAGVEEHVWGINKTLKEEYGRDIIVSTRLSIGNAESCSGGHCGTLEIELEDGENRPISSAAVAQRIRERTGNIKEAQNFTVGSRQFFGKPVSVRLLSQDKGQLEKAVYAFKDSLRAMSSLNDITDNNLAGKREVILHLKPKAFILGLDYNTVMQQVRSGFFGSEAQRIIVGTDEVKIWVRYPLESRSSIGDLENLRIRTPEGGAYPLHHIADYHIERGVVDIKHYNGKQVIQVEAALRDADEPSGPINDKIGNEILPAITATFPDVSFTYGGQKEDNEKLQASIKKIVPILLMAIFLIITLTFRSVGQPFLVLLMIVPAIFAAQLGHWIENKPVVTMSSFGMIALAGVIINDAVVFTEKFNQNLRAGMTVKEAVYDAGVSRFRAIMLTSITTVVGLYPLIFEKSIQAQFLIPMAITVAYGVLFGTLFILIFYPAILMMANDVRRVLRWFKRLFRMNLLWLWNGEKENIWPSREEVEPAVKERH